MVVDIGVVVVLIGLSVTVATAALSTLQTGYVTTARLAAVGLAAAGIALALATDGLPVAVRLVVCGGLAVQGLLLLWLLGSKQARAWLAQQQLASARRDQRELWQLAQAPWF
ncbi:hypothetical protein [Micromonospora sp. NPDC048063]|uniref:hypothetical protein n=1 Tax=Micromonospora sp. NPDC048063 TaxID=3364256 RepID=UPI0037158AE2